MSVETPKAPENGTEAPKTVSPEELKQQIETLTAQLAKEKGIKEEVIKQRDALKLKPKPPEVPDGNISPDLLTIQAQLASLEASNKSFQEREEKRKEKLNEKWKANLLTIPEDKRAIFKPILDQAEKMEPDERLEWFENTASIFTGGEPKKTKIPSFNPPSNEPTVTLTPEEKKIADEYGYSAEKATAFKTSDPTFFQRAIENRKTKRS